MFVSTDGTIIIDGCSSNTTPLYKRSEDRIDEGTFYIADGKGGYLGAMAVSITDDVVVYFIATEELSSMATYSFCGTTAPTNTDVYISKGFEHGNIEMLKSNIIAQGKSDDAGEFAIENVSGIDGAVSLWICVSAEYGQTGGITHTMQASSQNTDINSSFLAYQYFEAYETPVQCPVCKGTGVVGDVVCTTCKSVGELKGTLKDPLYILKGTCSEDISTLRVSVVDNMDGLVHSDEVIQALLSNVVFQGNVLDGKYEAQFTTRGNKMFAIWGVSEISDNFTIDDASVTEGYIECLSADTLITMADGSKRRIDELSIGELVMDGDGNPTKIHSISRGRFSPYYTIHTFEDGTTVKEVKRHRFYNADQGFFQYVDKWKIGEHAVKQNGEKVALVSSERVYERTERFGLWTKKGSYFANELLSGMAFCNKRLLANATSEQAVNMMMSIAESQLLQLVGLEGVLP